MQVVYLGLISLIRNSMNPVVHFEMPYEDKNRMASFYKKAFGWKPNMLGPEMGNYVVMMTTEMDKKTKFPKKPGRINGGFFKKTKSSQHPSIVIAVHDIRSAMKKVQKAGGKIVGGLGKTGEPDNIPGVGLYISIKDTEGNKASLIQPDNM